MKEVQQALVQATDTIKDALKRMDQAAIKVLFVVNQDGVLEGALSDGDLRRALLSGCDMNARIQGHFNRSPIAIEEQESHDPHAVRRLMIERKVGVIPVLDDARRVVGILKWEEVFGADDVPQRTRRKLDIPVVIMAGGKGTRMEPFTTVLPKPLIPVGGCTILERIIGQFLEYGINDFYLTLNYRGEMIRAYLDGLERSYRTHYLWENEFLGTAGSLKLAQDAPGDHLIVSNCDVLLSTQFDAAMDFHVQHDASLTVFSAVRHFAIPYGVVEFSEGGLVTSIREKPEYSMTVNTGVYILRKDCLGLIPEHTVYHMTDLIRDLLSNGRRVATFPVTENDFIDIGQWDAYRKTVALLQYHSDIPGQADRIDG